MKNRNHLAASLADRKYAQRIVKARKGTGSYTRKNIKVKIDK
jgi:stalled ribosome alternative rescue factor ArfA